MRAHFRSPVVRSRKVGFQHHRTTQEAANSGIPSNKVPIASLARSELGAISRRTLTQASVLWTASGLETVRAVSTRATNHKDSKMLDAWATLCGVNKDNDDLVQELEMHDRLKSRRVADAMRKVDRKFFIRPDMHALQAYSDQALPIGYGQTISAPHMHAAALELLERNLRPGASVLDVGSGSGYLSTVMGHLVSDTGHVLGIERVPQLAQRSIPSLRRAAPELYEKGTVTLKAGNALDDPALDEYGPFSAIHVGAAASDLPQVLIDKLKPGGRMVIPVGEQNDLQVLKCIDKDKEGMVTSRDMMGVLFVPLKDSAMPAHPEVPHHRDPEL
ncbi:Protein-L-isoaspartate(D-aspartate) O-methyltransferase [Coccomyxa sp. Obi]|nr:Protein-L-isoaspartate(D-aspartate) O-methyltransferase [Coccomyxa sp. Obi]